jgi:hypothetical protein
MNSTVHTHHCRDGHGFSRLIFLPVLALCLAFALNGSAAAAADSSYVNNAIVAYPGTAPYPPQIDATNFINNNSFTVNFTAINNSFLIQPYYESMDTLNYTNTGLLMVNAGFRFDTLSGSTGFHTRAANFFNSGTVSCGSINDTSDPLFGLFAAEGFAQCFVDATNLLNPGELDIGENGLIHLSGNNVDLTGSLLTIEGAGANVAATSAFGLNTNFWDPTLFLGPTVAESAFFPIPPFFLDLTNSTAYFDHNQVVINGTNVIRAVFIQDTSGSNVNVNVFFDTGFVGLGGGNVTIQWAGSYLDPATGLSFSNYLYLNDDYVLGASTNLLPIVGVPANFTFTEFTSPQLLLVPPATPGFPFPSPFFPGDVTNYYVYANMSLLASFSTNLIPNQSITNLPGRVEISADSQLSLAFAQITGQSYMSLKSTNQFNGSQGAFIQTPYADINLGSTNGPLILTNVMESTIPLWGGTVQAWNTRWILADTTLGVTNDYRILIVASQLTPEISAQVQNLILRDYHSNSIVISDTYNVMNSFYADPQSLTLTTNPIGNGATSFDGELNLQSPNIFFQNSTPNLRWLTNYGAIRMQNLGYFGYPTETNVAPPVPASGMLSEIGTNAVKKDKVTVGSNQYLFVSTLTNSVANEVQIVPASFDASMSNLIAAINGAAGAGVAYSTATKSNSLATAGPLINHAFTVTARTNGTGGNTIATTFTAATTSINLSWGGHVTLFGGAATTTNHVPYLFSTALINNGIFSDQGSIFYAGNFESSGIFSNGIGSFSLLSLTTTLTNGAFYAGGDVSITASSLVTSNLFMQASRSLTLTVTNLLTDSGPSPTNGNIWQVGSASVGSGFNLPIKPATGDLLGTMITLIAPTNRTVASVWAGVDRGLSTAGYANNAAVGQLTMDVINPAVNGHNGVLTFSGAGISNALYIDELILTNFATHGSNSANYNFPWLKINTNMFVYFAQALANGSSVAEAIDDASRIGANGGRLRWIYSYAGYFSSTNIVYTNADMTLTTNTFNAALAESPTIDSDSDGFANLIDPTPFFVPSQIKLTATITNVPPKMVKVQWTTIPNATNFVYYTTNLMATNWLPFTNFSHWYFGNSVPVTNSTHGNSFHSPQVYISSPPPGSPDNFQQTNVWILDSITNVPHYYKVTVWPWLDFPE